jgi:hypothetical protein
MPVFEIQTPDGRTLDIEAPDEATAIAGAQEWYAANKDPKKVADAEVRAGTNEPDFRGGGFFGDFGRKAQRFSDMVTDPLGLQDEIVGAGQFARELVTSGGDLEKAKEGYTRGAERIRAERRVAREDNGYLGTAAEIAGSLGSGKIATNAPTIALGAWETAKQAAKAGGLYGGITGATNAEGGVTERAGGAVAGGLTGAVLGPAISNIAVPGAARLFGAGKDAYNYAARQVHAARNPEAAAVDAVADQMVESSLSPAAVRAAIAPRISSNLAQRGLTDADAAEIVSRALHGESAASIGQSYGIGDKAVRRYLKEFRENNPTPLNILDVAVEQKNYQGAMPLLRRARANYGIAPDNNIAAELESRQLAQPGRVADRLQQSAVVGDDQVARKLDDQVRYLEGTAKKEENAAYKAVRAQQADVDVSSVLREARRRAQGRHGEIGTSVNKAVDMFFEPELREAAQGPMIAFRIREQEDKVARLTSEAMQTGDYSKAATEQLRLAAMREQDEFSRPLKSVAVGQPIKDVQKFLDARQELDQMIARSLDNQGKPTPLTAELTAFRTEINYQARQTNPALEAADARFYGNRRSDELIKEGQQLAVGLNPRSREAMRDFETLTPTQQEVFRTAFEQNLANKALSVTDGNGAARQFQSQGFREIVEAFYPKKAGPEIYARGQKMLRDLKRESISTTTSNFATNRQNSPTGFILNDMDEALQNVRAGADLATGRFGKLLENLSNRLAKQIGAQAAGHQLRIVTQTDPALLLPLLNRLEVAAQSSAARRAKVTDVRALRAMNRPGVAAVVGQEAGQYQGQP